MKLRLWFVLGAVAWALLVGAGLVALPLAFADRLPDPLATHWGPSGVADGSMSRSGFLLVPLIPWTAIVAASFLFALRGGLRRRFNRAWMCGSLVGGAAFVFGIAGTTVWANAGAEHWRQARSLSWQGFLVFGLAALIAVGTSRLANRGPDVPRPETGPGPELRLRAGQRAVWVGAVSSRVLLVLSLASLLIALMFAVMGSYFDEELVWSAPVVLVLCGLVCLVLSSMRVQVGDNGVRIAFGPLRWPVRRLALERIESAGAERRSPVEVGGWGYRVLPGQTAIMLRGGECLVLRLTSGRRFYISVDGAERGAELVNALVTERSALGDGDA
ncbi:DUF1648 domain-containing protein [Saccharopolyspora taberi]|uniref:DUF1648 domain-containing protein n=1 Tax=Saccharopolyspora taberi TaxID=60895 RepID=A0ABN3V5Z1_9PSEU